ncbi:MAG TPA: hypothetical protein VGK17_01705 [Propionicimonas sp.]
MGSARTRIAGLWLLGAAQKDGGRIPTAHPGRLIIPSMANGTATASTQPQA